MGFLSGRGRYARQTYPDAARASSVSSGLIQTAKATASSTPINGTLATVVGGGTTVTGGAGRSVILMGTGTIVNTTGVDHNFNVALFVGGVNVEEISCFVPASTSNGGFTVTFQAAIAGAGSHAIDLQVQGPSSASGTAANCSLVGMVVNV